MKPTKKLTYTAAATALAVVCILLSRFLPLKFTPLLVVSVCFFIALSVGIGYGLMCMAASMLLTFFFGSFDVSMLLILLFFAPFSIFAYFVRMFEYKTVGQTAVRVAGTVILFNVALAVLVFAFGSLAEDLLFGFDLGALADKLGSKAMVYVLLCIVGSLFAVGFDYMFLIACKVITKRIKLENNTKKPKDTDKNSQA